MVFEKIIQKLTAQVEKVQEDKRVMRVSFQKVITHILPPIVQGPLDSEFNLSTGGKDGRLGSGSLMVLSSDKF